MSFLAALALLGAQEAPVPDRSQDMAWQSQQMLALAKLNGADGWHSTPEGLRWRRVKGDGTGRHPTVADTVTLHYAGTVGPESLSSGGGTPRWRGNWQNTFTFDQVSLSTTTYFIGSMKGVAADQATSDKGDISCSTAAIYKPLTGNADFCHIKSFIYTDVNLTVKVNDQFSFFGLVGNVTNARAPLFANTAYPSQVNTLTSWHSAGLIGRTFRAGANFKF